MEESSHVVKLPKVDIHRSNITTSESPGAVPTGASERRPSNPDVAVDTYISLAASLEPVPSSGSAAVMMSSQSAPAPAVAGRSRMPQSTTEQAVHTQNLALDPKPIDLWPSKTRQEVACVIVPAAKRNPRTGKMEKKPNQRVDVLDLTTPEPHLLALLNRRIALGLEDLERCNMLEKTDEAVIRAKVHRDAFEVLINEFRSYRPLLSRIMAAYENALEVQGEEIKSLKPLKRAAAAYKADFERRWLEKKSMEDHRVKALQLKIKEQSETIWRMHEEEKDWQAQIDKLSTELGVAYKRYREEADEKSMLVTELNEMHYKEQDLARDRRQQDDTPEEDPVVQRLIINQLRTDLKDVQRKLVETIADYGDVVPRKDFDKVTKSKKRCEKELKTLQSSHKKLRKEHSSLQEAHAEVLKQRDAIGSEYVEVQRSCTPRPDWSVFEEELTPEDGDWSDIRDTRTSKQMADAVLAQVKKEPLPEVVDGKYGPQAIKAKGTGATVPRHLRADGIVRNRHIRHKEALAVINDLWSSRPEPSGEEKLKKRTGLSDHVCSFLEKRYVLPTLCTEWAYSMDDACKRYAPDDAHIGLFHAIINKQMDESVHHTQMKRFQSLEESLLEAARRQQTEPDREGEGEEEEEEGETSEDVGKGVLSATALSECLRAFFPVKTPSSIDELCDCAVDEATLKPSPAATDSTVTEMEEQDQQAGEVVAETEVEAEVDQDEEPAVIISKLFDTGETGYTAEFIHLLREQERQEKMEYMTDISSATDVDQGSEVSLEQLRKAIQSVDPDKAESDVNQMLAYAFATPISALQPGKTSCEHSVMCERLQARGLHRAGIKPTAASLSST